LKKIKSIELKRPKRLVNQSVAWFQHLSRPMQLAVGALILSLGIVGGVQMHQSFAATYIVMKEAESGVISGVAGAGDPVNASNGASVKFGITTGDGGGGSIGNDKVGPDGTLSGNQYYCAQPNAGVGAVGVRLVTQDCNKSTPQTVNYIASSSNEGGLVRFKTSSLCMTEVGTADLSQVQVVACDNTKDAMRWISQDDNSLQNAESGKCLRPKGGAVGAGYYLEITNCNNPANSPNQLWCLPNTCNGSLTDVFGAEGRLAGNQNYCAQPNAGVGGVGVRLVTQVCNSTTPQQMVAIFNATRYSALIRFKNSYLCMAEDGTADLSQVVLAKCEQNNNSMRWIPTTDNALKNAESNKCLRPKGGAVGVGFYLETTNCNSTSASPNQYWSLQ
jgi:hypothetical protein